MDKKTLTIYRTIVIMTSVLLLMSGCNVLAPSYSTTREPAIYPPSSVPLHDYGKVVMLYGGDNLTELSHDTKRQDVILSAVSQALLNDKNIKVDIQADFAQEPAERLKQLLASNEPPSICLWQPKTYTATDNSVLKTSALPLCLNNSLDTYGSHLKELIPQYIWDSESVRGKIYSIPTLKIDSRIVIANKKLLELYGWTIPTSIEEFENIVEDSTSRNPQIVPIATAIAFDVAQDWFDASLNEIVETSDGLVSSAVSVNYYAWLEKMRNWVDKGWLKRKRPSSDLDEIYGGVSTDKWLFSEAYLSEMAYIQNAILLPPIAAVSGGPRHSGILHQSFSYESYINPDVLVILMDWLITSEENSRLMGVGIKDKDYRFISENEYEWIDGPSWPGYSYFPVSGLFSKPILRKPNSDAYLEAVSYYSNYKAYTPKKWLPSGASTFCLENTRLDRAIKGYEEYRITARNASIQYIWGDITLSGYQEAIGAKQLQLQTYLDLLSDIARGGYNVNDDIYNPFEGEVIK